VLDLRADERRGGRKQQKNREGEESWPPVIHRGFQHTKVYYFGRCVDEKDLPPKVQAPERRQLER
jgi:hypothetical protein